VAWEERGAAPRPDLAGGAAECERRWEWEKNERKLGREKKTGSHQCRVLLRSSGDSEHHHRFVIRSDGDAI
jgi:hypothetical protein